MADPGVFLISFRSFQQQYTEKFYTLIWTRIVGVEGEHADHLTTTIATPKLSSLRY